MADRKKIALCLEYPIALRGGVSVLVETLLEGLKEHYELVLVSRDPAGSLENHPVGKIITAHIEWKPGEVSPKISRALAEQLKQHGVQLAHFHSGGNFGWGNRFPGYSPMVYADQLGIPVFSTVHLVVSVLDGFCGPQKPLWFKLAMLPLAWAGKMQSLAAVRREIAVSQHDLEKLQRWYWPRRGKFLQMYHSRLRENSRPTATVAREPIVLNVGHVAWRKGQLLLAEAFARVAAKFPEWKLWLAGDLMETATVEKIRALAQRPELRERIVLLGERNDALELMRRAGVYVQPSYHEALGLALQEAMFVGCPSIGTRAGGIPELIENERTGLLVDVGNAAQMAGALEKMMASPELRKSYSERGAEAIVKKGMTVERMVARQVELYESQM
jgi:glycosyltransferase involved in cell wall biosynthesis